MMPKSASEAKAITHISTGNEVGTVAYRKCWKSWRRSAAVAAILGDLK